MKLIKGEVLRKKMIVTVQCEYVKLVTYLDVDYVLACWRDVKTHRKECVALNSNSAKLMVLSEEKPLQCYTRTGLNRFEASMVRDR